MNIPAPRLCRLSRASTKDKFGFHLTGQKNKPGQCHISNVEEGSPAQHAGLQIGDRIVEVEGENVSLENHGQVVSRIAVAGLRLSLLVVDSECEEFHRQKNIVITSTLPHTIEIRNSCISEDINKTVVTVNCDNSTRTDLNNNSSETDSEPEQSYHLNIEIVQDKDTTINPVEDSRPSKAGDSELNSKEVEDTSDDIMVSLARTAKEMREIIMGRKKRDPRKEKRKDLRRRVEMIEEL